MFSFTYCDTVLCSNVVILQYSIICIICAMFVLKTYISLYYRMYIIYIDELLSVKMILTLIMLYNITTTYNLVILRIVEFTILDLYFFYIKYMLQHDQKCFDCRCSDSSFPFLVHCCHTMVLFIEIKTFIVHSIYKGSTHRKWYPPLSFSFK